MSIAILIFKSIFFDTIISILYFPIWWYTVGIKKRSLSFINGASKLAHNLALKLMLTHIFKPMFGERTRSGRIISFFMRLILLIWRFFLFLLGALWLLLLLIIWIILPIVAVWQIIALLGA